MFICARSEQCDWLEAQLIFQSSKDDKILQFYMISVLFFHVFIVNN